MRGKPQRCGFPLCRDPTPASRLGKGARSHEAGGWSLVVVLGRQSGGTCSHERIGDRDDLFPAGRSRQALTALHHRCKLDHLTLVRLPEE